MTTYYAALCMDCEALLDAIPERPYGARVVRFILEHRAQGHLVWRIDDMTLRKLKRAVCSCQKSTVKQLDLFA